MLWRKPEGETAMRRASVRLAIILAAAALTAGCIHAVELQPLDGGQPGIGDVTLRGRGMAVRVDGKRYSGPFIPATSPELSLVGGPSAGPFAAGRYWGVQGVRGHTGAVLTAKDGATIACRFSYDPPSML